MLTSFLRALYFGLLRLIIPPPDDLTIPLDTPCVACGHVGSTFHLELVKQGQDDKTPAVMQWCDTCGAGYAHVPLLRRVDAKAIIQPARDTGVHEQLKSLTQNRR